LSRAPTPDTRHGLGRQWLGAVAGGITLPNPQSIALHRNVGFTEIGILKNVGYKFDKYIDVGLWQMSVV